LALGGLYRFKVFRGLYN